MKDKLKSAIFLLFHFFLKKNEDLRGMKTEKNKNENGNGNGNENKNENKIKLKIEMKIKMKIKYKMNLKEIALTINSSNIMVQ